MNHRLILVGILLVCTLPLGAVTPTYKIRSQARDKTREVVGTTDKVNRVDMEDMWGVFSIIPEYTQSFKSSNICSCLFGNSISSVTTTASTSGCNECDCSNACCAIAVQGSSVANRSATAWFADYFYLPRDFNGSISFKPKISNFVLDFDLFMGLDNWRQGLYLRLYGPFVHSRWDLNFCESVTARGTASYVQGYFTPTEMPASSLLTSFASYASGSAPKPVSYSEVGPVIVNTFIPLKYAKIGQCSRSDNGFADLRAEFGWNFLQKDRYHLGLNIQAAAPTGPRMHAEWLFNPQIGNGHHWELGGGLTGHWNFWQSEDAEKHVGLYVDLNVTHLFKSREQRTFDLKNKPMSRYMLAMQFGPNTQNLNGGGGVASKQFTGTYSPVANLTTVDVNVSVGAQVDLVALCNFTCGKWSLDVGYNLWAQTCEDIGCVTQECCGAPITICNADQQNTWGLKGDAKVYGFPENADLNQPALLSLQPVALSATNSTATVFTGTAGNDTSASSSGASRNSTVDNAQLSFAGGSPSETLFNNSSVFATNIQIYTSIQPVFISCNDLDLTGVKGLSNKVFSHLNYTFEGDRWTPYIGVGGYAEFGQSGCGDNCSSTTSPTTSGCGDCSDSCNNCIHCSLSQWGVWLKTGVSFN